MNLTRPTNIYEALGLAPTADTKTIDNIIRRKLYKYHPDRNRGDPQCTEICKEISNYRDILLDPTKRAAHDTALREHGTSSRDLEAQERQAARRQQREKREQEQLRLRDQEILAAAAARQQARARLAPPAPTQEPAQPQLNRVNAVRRHATQITRQPPRNLPNNLATLRGRPPLLQPQPRPQALFQGPTRHNALKRHETVRAPVLRNMPEDDYERIARARIEAQQSFMPADDIGWMR